MLIQKQCNNLIFSGNLRKQATIFFIIEWGRENISNISQETVSVWQFFSL